MSNVYQTVAKALRERNSQIERKAADLEAALAALRAESDENVAAISDYEFRAGMLAPKGRKIQMVITVEGQVINPATYEGPLTGMTLRDAIVVGSAREGKTEVTTPVALRILVDNGYESSLGNTPTRTSVFEALNQGIRNGVFTKVRRGIYKVR